MSSDEEADLRSTLGDELKSLIKFDSARWYAVVNSTAGSSHFSFTVPREFAKDVTARSLCLIVANRNEDDTVLLGYVHSKSVVATLDTRIVVNRTEAIEPSTFVRLIAALPSASARSRLFGLYESDATVIHVGDKLGHDIIDALIGFDENRIGLRRLASLISRPRRYVDASALQQNAVTLALNAFGIRTNEAAIELALSNRYTSLASVRVREDAVIAHEARWFPGFVLSDSDVTGRVTFERGDERLDVYTANKLPLEELFGIDLIYYNARRQSVVMVQYKMLEPGRTLRTASAPDYFDDEVGLAKSDWVYYADDQLEEEIVRMRRFDSSNATGDYRLSNKAFYLKFVRRNSLTRSAGIILALDHYCGLRDNPKFGGRKGGIRLSYERLDGHYLRTDTFAELIRSGYIGSSGTTTQALVTLVESVSTRGKALVTAIQSSH